jgi:tRNA threonylcarbamoyladenosine biosynthesis protein TsaB
MSAKAFAYATGCKLLMLDTFAIIAAQAPSDVSRLVVVADAQQDKVYVQEFERAGNDMVPLTKLCIEPWGPWADRQAGPSWISGPGLRKWAVHLPAALRSVEPTLWDPQPEQLLRLALDRYHRGEQDDVWSAEPLYLRASAAENQWAQRAVDNKR